MFQLLKQLLVVAVFASGVFYLARPIAERYASKEDVARRRNLWLLLTAAAFFSPSFWLYLVLAVAMLVIASKRDDNPVAVYLLLFHVLPPNGIPIPFPVELFSLDNYRILALTILLPLFLRLRKDPNVPNRGLGLPDYLLIGYGLLTVVLWVPPDLPGHVILPDSVTNKLRRAVLYFLDVFVLHYAISRGCIERRKLLDAGLYLAIGLTIMSAVAVFESARHWLMYDGIFARWSPQLGSFVYLMRGESLRAMVTAGQSLPLGVMLAVGFGLVLGMRQLMPSRQQWLGAMALIWLGLVASYSRGPWIGAVLMGVVFVVVSSRSVGKILKGGLAIGAILGGILVSPIGEKVRSVLPFFGGKVDNFNVIYRHRLAERALQLIGNHPFFGDQLAYRQMEDLRQGEGIVDLVNTYAATALFYGLIGLALLFGYILVVAFRTLSRARAVSQTDPELAQMGFGLFSAIAGLLMMLYAMSFIEGPEKLYYILGGFCSAFVCAKATAPVTQTVRGAEPAKPLAKHRPGQKLRPWAPR